MPTRETDILQTNYVSYDKYRIPTRETDILQTNYVSYDKYRIPTREIKNPENYCTI